MPKRLFVAKWRPHIVVNVMPMIGGVEYHRSALNCDDFESVAIAKQWIRDDLVESVCDLFGIQWLGIALDAISHCVQHANDPLVFDLTDDNAKIMLRARIIFKTGHGFELMPDERAAPKRNIASACLSELR